MLNAVLSAPRLARRPLSAWVCVVAMGVSSAWGQPLPYGQMAERIVAALQVEAGERVLLRYDPETMADLLPVLRARLAAAGAEVEVFTYGPAPDLESRLTDTDVFVWLPAGARAETPADQREVLARWLDAGRGRQIHFHWIDGTRDVDGLPGDHAEAYDHVYVDALGIDHAAMSTAMERTIATLRSGEVRITTPAGTDIRFRVGERPFNKQDGDASRARMATARIRIDREIELPAGVLRVAPIETSVAGVIVLPAARFGSEHATQVRLEFERGAVIGSGAETSVAAVRTFLESAPGARRFREFALGFNPKLVVPDGHDLLPYYGYGAGVVRLSLGDNAELGGLVRGGGVRWLFFPDATVTVGDETVVDGGRLVGAAEP